MNASDGNAGKTKHTNVSARLTGRIAALLIAGMLLFGAVQTVVAEGEQESSQTVGPDMINWNEPNMVDRLTGDEYQLPNGWEEATAGVDELVFGNAGGISGDIATYMNMQRFEELTGIKVTAIGIPATVIDNKTLATLSSRDMSVHAPMVRHKLTLSTYASAGWLRPIDELWPEDVQELYGTTRYLKYDGHFYGGSNTVNPSTEFYRPSWFERAGVEVPDNFEELLPALRDVSEWAKENIGQDAYAVVFSGAQVFVPMTAMVHSQGEYVYDEDGYHFDEEPFQNAFKFLVTLVREELTTPEVVSFDFNQAGSFLGRGKAAYGINLKTSYQMQYVNQYPEVEGDWAMQAPLKWSPNDPESYRSTEVSAGGTGVPSYQDPEYQAATMLWIDFLRSKEARTNEVVVEGNEALMSRVYDDPNAVSNVDWELANQAAADLDKPEPARPDGGIPNASIRSAIARNIRSESFGPGFPQIRAQIQEGFVSAATGQVSADEALDRIIEFTNQIQQN